MRIKYKLAMTVYKCLHGLAPTYLVDDCHAISAIAGKRHLRSADTGTLFVPRTTTTLGMRSFAVAGPRIWNSLPAALRTATLSPLTFARHLKSHLFDWLTKGYLGRTLQICASSSSSSSVHTCMASVCGTLHWKLSTKYRDVVWYRLPDRQPVHIMPPITCC